MNYFLLQILQTAVALLTAFHALFGLPDPIAAKWHTRIFLKLVRSEFGPVLRAAGKPSDFNDLVTARYRIRGDDSSEKTRVRPLDLKVLLKAGRLIPQAVFRKSVVDFARKADSGLFRGVDDLDEYEGTAFILDKVVPIAIMRHAGHPEGTSTLYLPYVITNLQLVTNVISATVEALHLPVEVVAWQRADDPDL